MPNTMIVFALVVMLDSDTDEKVASYWFKLQRCLASAQELTNREKLYKPAKAHCKPIWVNPNEQEVVGYVAPAKSTSQG
jgi:hypothetical protein